MNPISLAVENSGEMPPEIVERMRALGLFGLAIPTRYNGLGLSTLGEIRVYEELTRTNACFRSRIGTSNGIGSMGILFDGTEAQKQHYLPRIASGDMTAAFALTEPDAGSDAGSISTYAALDGDSWVINGSKVADRVMDIIGQESYLTQNQIEMFLRDVRLYRIFEGTSEIQRLLISRQLLQEKR